MIFTAASSEFIDFGDVLEAYRTIDEHPDRWIKLAVKYRRGEK